jgi:hypothetical protein
MKPGFYVPLYNKGGDHKVDILEDTIMSEKEARERAGRHREVNWDSVARAARTPPIGENPKGSCVGSYTA